MNPLSFVVLLVAFRDSLVWFRWRSVKLFSKLKPSEPFSLTGIWLQVRAAIVTSKNIINVRHLI